MKSRVLITLLLTIMAVSATMGLFQTNIFDNLNEIGESAFLSLAKSNETDSKLEFEDSEINRQRQNIKNTEPISNIIYDITKFNRTHITGKPISFDVVVQGYGSPCIPQHYEIGKQKGSEIIWEYKDTSKCIESENIKIKKTFHVPDTHIVSPIINETGTYWLRVFNDQGYMSTQFIVVDDLFVRNVDPCNPVYSDDIPYGRVPPPSYIGERGREMAPFEAGLIYASTKISEPTPIPLCFELKTARVLGDTTTIVYYPKDMPFGDDTSITKIISEGMMILLTRNSDDSLEWEKHLEDQVNGAPDVRSIVQINGHTVMLVHGIPTMKKSSRATTMIDNLQIQLISTKLDSDYLLDVLDSMIDK